MDELLYAQQVLEFFEFLSCLTSLVIKLLYIISIFCLNFI